MLLSTVAAQNRQRLVVVVERLLLLPQVGPGHAHVVQSQPARIRHVHALEDCQRLVVAIQRLLVLSQSVIA
jgi:hypothetical protein